MIDKLALRIPGSAPFRPNFDLLHERLIAQASDAIRASRYYLRAVDLRPLGIPAILHEHCQMGQQDNHKLEFIAVGGLAYSAVAAHAGRVFAIDPLPLELMRLDLAADVPGYTPAWFRAHARVLHKRHAAELGELEGEGYAALGSARIETLYSGKRPDMIRIYDKVAERRARYAQLQRAARKEDEAVPPFEAMFGHPPTGYVLTRVEHEYGSGKVPPELATLALLRDAARFNPFSKIELLTCGLPEPDPDEYPALEYVTGRGLRAVIGEWGLVRMRAWLNKRSRSNAAKILARYADFLPADDCSNSPPDLFALYRDSVGRQLAA